MNIQNLADTLNTLAAGRGYYCRARANHGPEGTAEAIEYVDRRGNSIMTLTRGDACDSTEFAAAAERSLNGLGDNPPADYKPGYLTRPRCGQCGASDCSTPNRHKNY